MPKATRPKPPEALSAPEWVTHTPDPIDSFQLGYFQGGEEIQLIQITPPEYEALKRHLAMLRGYLSADLPPTPDRATPGAAI